MINNKYHSESPLYALYHQSLAAPAPDKRDFSFVRDEKRNNKKRKAKNKIYQFIFSNAFAPE